jgi:hypothetical protein
LWGIHNYKNDSRLRRRSMRKGLIIHQKSLSALRRARFNVRCTSRWDARQTQRAGPGISLVDEQASQCALLRDRGREGHRPPLPPNRACGFPAHGSPVSGFLIGIDSLGGLWPW